MTYSLLLAGAASLYLLIGILIFQKETPAYSWVRNTISELGETGSRNSGKVSYLLFLPLGFTLAAIAGINFFSTHDQSMSQNLIGLSASVGIGYIIAAFFPCDPGSPLTGSSRQSIHNLGGFIEYVGGAYFMNQVDGQYFRYASILVLGIAVLLSFPTPWRGLIQRIAEVTLFSGIVWLSK